MRWLLPHFLGIGMRARTSWLAAHLGRHPAIRIDRKELHFFDRHLDRRKIPFLAADRAARWRYSLRFLPGALQRRAVTGEFTPAYAILDPPTIATTAVVAVARELVHRWMPDLKLLYIMRDPVERAWSQVRHDFARVGRPVETASRAELTAFVDAPRVRARGDYLTCIENWLTLSTAIDCSSSLSRISARHRS